MSRSFRSRFGRREPDPSDSGPDPSDSGPDESDSAGPAGAAPDDEGRPVEDEAGDWVAYDLHEWSLEARLMLAQLVTAEKLPHAWQGTTLLVHEDQEEAVDELIDEVEDASDGRIEPGDPVVGFEMDEWAGELLAELIARLGGAGVPHEIDEDGDLIVREADEEQVELIIEDLIARAQDEGLEELDGLEVNSLLSELFVACDRLRRDVRDADGVLDAVRYGKRLAEVATPYGFSGTSWRGLRERSAELVEMLEGGEVGDDELRSHAHELRDVLQQLI